MSFYSAKNFAIVVAGPAVLALSPPLRAQQEPSPAEGTSAEKLTSTIAQGFARDSHALSILWSTSPVTLRAQHWQKTRRQQWATNEEQKKVYNSFAQTQHSPFDATIGREAKRVSLDPFLLKGLLVNESRLQPNRTSKLIYAKVSGKRRVVGGGARGIAQFTNAGIDAVNEARQRLQSRGLRVRAFERNHVWKPELAIAAAADLLSSYIQRYDRDGGVTAYNTGPGGGRLVKARGFYRARRTGRLSRHGDTRLQGHRFLINVLRHTNRFRKQANLAKLPGPDHSKSLPKRVKERKKRRKTNKPGA